MPHILRICRLLAGAFMLVLAVPSLPGVHAESGNATAIDRETIDAYIHDYIMKNPQVLRDALQKLDADEQAEHTKKILRGFKDELYAAGSPEIGDKAAKVSIVEFYDYNCPYCRSSYPRVKAFLKANPDTKLILKDVASFGKDSEAVAKIALAANEQGHFEAMHDALMTVKGHVDEARALELASKLGLNIQKLKADAKSAKIDDALAKSQDLANRLTVSTTPLFIIGNNGIVGVPDDFDAQLSGHVAEIRKSGCDVC